MNWLNQINRILRVIRTLRQTKKGLRKEVSALQDALNGLNVLLATKQSRLDRLNKNIESKEASYVFIDHSMARPTEDLVGISKDSFSSPSMAVFPPNCRGVALPAPYYKQVNHEIQKQIQKLEQKEFYARIRTELAKEKLLKAEEVLKQKELEITKLQVEILYLKSKE